MDKRRVVITGMGAITPIGHTAQESWEAAKRGVCGIDTIKLFDPTEQKVHLDAEVKDYRPEDYLSRKEIKQMERFTQFVMISAREALADSGLEADQFNPDRAGTIVSSCIGGLKITETEHDLGLAKGFDRVSPYYVPLAINNMAAAHVAILADFRGPCYCPGTACAGGTYAVGEAFHSVRDGYSDLMLCGGTESCITPLSVGGFTSMRALTHAQDPARASIPFDAERSGFVIGEGAGLLLLEELSHAQARHAKIYAEIVGYGATCDAFHMTAPRPDGSGNAKAMALALQDGAVAPECVDYINAHGTSTPMNDSSETAAVKAVFGPWAHQLAISSSKSMTGHMISAAGAVEGIFTALALRDSYLSPTIHYQVPDPECDLDIVPNQGRAATLRYAISNSMGFGGHNSSILLKKWEE